MQFKHKHAYIASVEVFTVVGLLVTASLTLAQGDTWTEKAPMPTARLALAASVVDGKIYAIGGRDDGTLATEYDPATDTWTTKTRMPTSRFGLATGVVDGKIYAIGGTQGPGGASAARVATEEYDPVTDTWTKKTNMPTARSFLFASAVDGKIYAIGGSASPPWSTHFRTVEAYDPATDTWTEKADMPTARVYSSTSVVDGKIYAIGGALTTKEELSTVEVYDPATDAWTTKTTMPTARYGHAAGVVDGKIYAIGGGTWSATGFSAVEAYEPATDTWTRRADMPAPRVWLAASVVEGKIYAFGGTTSVQDIHPPGVRTVYEYTPLVTSVKDPFAAQNNPREFVLYPNYPNPFNPETKIDYKVPKQGRMVLQVINMQGQLVRTLVDENIPAGFYEVRWNGKDNHGQRVASGVYLYKLQTKDFVQTRKMVLLQ